MRYLRLGLLALALALFAMPLGQTSIFDIGEDVAFIASGIALDVVSDAPMVAVAMNFDQSYANAPTQSLNAPTLSYVTSGALWSYGDTMCTVFMTSTGILCICGPANYGQGYNVLKMPRTRGARANEMNGEALPANRLQLS